MENDATPLCGKLCVALNFLLMPLSHALGDHPVTRRNNFLTLTPPSPATARRALRVLHPPCRCWSTRPAHTLASLFITGATAGHFSLVLAIFGLTKYDSVFSLQSIDFWWSRRVCLKKIDFLLLSSQCVCKQLIFSGYGGCVVSVFGISLSCLCLSSGMPIARSRGPIFFVFDICLKQIFLGTKLGGAQKFAGVLHPNGPRG